MDDGPRAVSRQSELVAATRVGGARKRSFAARPGRGSLGIAAIVAEVGGDSPARGLPGSLGEGCCAPAGPGSEAPELSDSSLDSQAESLPPPWDERCARWEARSALLYRGSPRTAAGSAAATAGNAGGPVSASQGEARVHSGVSAGGSPILKKKPKAEAAGTLTEPPQGARKAGAGGSNG